MLLIKQKQKQKTKENEHEHQENIHQEDYGPARLRFNNGWRIEAELKNYFCPVLPHLSIYNVIQNQKRFGFQGKTMDKEKIAKICDELNEMVRQGEIVLDGCEWVHKDAFSGRLRVDDEKILADYNEEKERQE